MKIGDTLTDRLTGRPMKLLEFLNVDHSLLLVDYDGKGEITICKEEIE